MHQRHPVIVVGAGICGVTCARELAAAEIPYRLLDRGRRIGGRMAVRTVEDRAVDLGASYFTAHDPLFADQVESWTSRGLARAWTDTFRIATPDGLQGTKTGPVRYAAAGGLRALVEDLAAGLSVENPVEVLDVTVGGSGPLVDGAVASAVVLAMPDPQALDLVADDLVAERKVLGELTWEPVLALAACWPERIWPDLDGVFVNDSPVLTFVADDGARRGDGAPVLVAHAHPVFSARHLDEPEDAAPAMLAELTAVLGLGAAPSWQLVKRWGVTKPLAGRDEPYFLGVADVGLAGDGWHGGPRIEAAYLSGRALGVELVRRLG